MQEDGRLNSNAGPKLDVIPLDGPFGAEIRDVDLSQPLDVETFEAIRFAFHSHGLLLFRGQDLTPAQHIAFSRPFGALEEHVQTDFLLPGHPEIFVVSNQTRDGKPIGATNCALSWHSDHSYHALPSLGSLFYGVVVPEVGGDTWFAEMYRPYEALPADRKQAIHGLFAVHDYRRLVEKQFPHRLGHISQASFDRVPPVAHPVARTHPVTRRKSLFLGGEVISHTIKDGRQDSRDIVADLLAWATQPRFVYQHRWRKGDLIFWDNRCMMHRAGGFDDGTYPRVMHRTTLMGGAPF
jgi:taurine dioxygenase